MNWGVITIISLLVLGALAGAGYWGYTKYMKHQKHEYTVQKDTDHPVDADKFLERLPTNNVEELKKACDANDKCVGFNTAGYLVPELSKAVEEKGVDFYVKGKPAKSN